MDFRTDPDGFDAPHERAFDDACKRVENAGTRVAGADRRSTRALRDLKSLIQFDRALQDLMTGGGFADLPKLRGRFFRIKHCHHLTVGVWRGVFFVRPDGSEAVGLLFSREPHKLTDYFHEVLSAQLGLDRTVESNDDDEGSWS